MSTTTCPYCGALVDVSAAATGSRTKCWDCGRSFTVPETAPARHDPDAARPTPYMPVPIDEAAPVPRRRQSVTVADDGPGAERWLVVAVCLLLLAVTLGGVGYLIWQAHSEAASGSGTSTAPAPRPPFRIDKDKWGDKGRGDWDDGPREKFEKQ